MPQKPRGGKIQVFSKNARCFAAFSKLRKHCSLCHVPRSKAAGSQHPPALGSPPHPSVIVNLPLPISGPPSGPGLPTLSVSWLSSHRQSSTRPTVTMSRHKAQVPQGGRKRLCTLAPRAWPAQRLREALGPAILNSPALTTYNYGQASQP